MEKRGEITVFLSLILVCTLSLLLGLLESARTAGSRLYLRMSADSAMSSVMSQYNRNLWDVYRLLFLEYESEEAIIESFADYLDFYMIQENFYPMKREQVSLTGMTSMMEQGGLPLEEGMISYMKYLFPETAADLLGLAKEVDTASRAGDLKALLEVCGQAGKKTRALERARKRLEEALCNMEKWLEEAKEAAGEERRSACLKNSKKLKKEMDSFSLLIESYEREIEKLSQYGYQKRGESPPRDTDAGIWMEKEWDAYSQVEQMARENLKEYQDMEQEISLGSTLAKAAMDYLEESGGTKEETDWEIISEYLEEITIPAFQERKTADREKEKKLDDLEALFQKDLLSFVLPRGEEISKKTVSLNMIPSKSWKGNEDTIPEIGLSAEQILVNQYINKFFANFLSIQTSELSKRELDYEQEYLLCGKSKDRDNLKGAAEQILAVRGAMNLIFLLGSPERKAQADSFAAAISAGYAPAQFILSFFILTLWALGEAMVDLRGLFSGGKVPFFKSEGQWRTDFQSLIAMEFLDMDSDAAEEGKTYGEYLQLLLLLKERPVRNYRIMDLIQWNLRTVQPDFSVSSCICWMEMEVLASQHHLFLTKEEYQTKLYVSNGY